MNSQFILIVEDCDDAVPALQIALESFYGCPVLHSPDGSHALSTLAARHELPLAIITDLNLPRTDGYKLISRIRSNPSWAQIPIVVISADTHPQTPERVRELGADAYFSKPYSPAGLCHCLEKILHAKSQLLTPDRITRNSGGSDRA